jgi:hypothetical protein
MRPAAPAATVCTAREAQRLLTEMLAKPAQHPVVGRLVLRSLGRGVQPTGQPVAAFGAWVHIDAGYSDRR